MYKRLNKLYTKYSNLGHKEDYNEFERTNNFLLNQIQIFIVLFLCLFVIKDIFDYNTDFFITGSFVIILGSYFFWREHVGYLTAVIFLLSFCVIAIGFEYYIHELELKVEPLYIVALVLGVLLLPKNRHKYIYTACVILSYLLIVFVVENYGILLRSTVDDYDNLLIFSFAFVMIFIIIFRYISLIKTIMENKIALVETLQGKNNELERFAYITSHDLKQPIRNIGSFAGLVKRFIDKPNRVEKNLEYLNEIEKSANRMNLLIEEILNFSKIDNAELSQEAVDLDTIMEDFKRSNSGMLNEKNAIIKYANLPIVQGNKLYLSLLFQNLIENGLKYNDSQKPEVNISSKVVGDQYEIKVADNGIGISEEFRASVFEPFKRLHSNKTYEGTGLGLSICNKIVENHNGDIRIEQTQKEQGSIFTINLPIQSLVG